MELNAASIRGKLRALWRALSSARGLLGLVPAVVGFVGALSGMLPLVIGLDRLCAALAGLLSIFALFLTLEVHKRRPLPLWVSIIFLLAALVQIGFYWVDQPLSHAALFDAIDNEGSFAQVVRGRLFVYLVVLEYALIFVWFTIAFTILGIHRSDPSAPSRVAKVEITASTGPLALPPLDTSPVDEPVAHKKKRRRKR